jgi:hypothetical protein
MEPKVDRLPIALKDDHPDAFITNVNFPEFKFKPGFKILFGLHLPRINWDTAWQWSELYSKTQKNLSSNTCQFLPAYYNEDFFPYGNSPRFQRVAAREKLYFNAINWDVGKSIWLTKALSLHIRGGVEGDFIKQALKVNYDGGNTTSGTTTYRIFSSQEVLNNTSKGAGIRIGFDSKWQTPAAAFSLLAAPSLAFILTSFNMFQYSRIAALASDLSGDTYANSFDKIKEHIWVVRPNAQIILGMHFGHCFNGCFLAFSAAYEAHYFWEQNLNRPSHIQRASYPTKGDLFLHGLNLAFKVEF